MIPNIAAILPANISACALHDKHGPAVRALFQCLVSIGFQRHRTAPAQPLISGNKAAGLTILNPARQRVRGKAAKHNRMNRPDTHHRQHRHRRFRDHRHIKRDPVALFHPASFQRIGKFTNFPVQVFIGDMAGLRRVIPLPDNGSLIAPLRQMPVKTVGRGVQRAIREPFDMHIRALIADIRYLAIGFYPVNALALLGPEAVRVAD